ncbi:MAG: hypothetical protein ACM3XR_11030 [Bacillota bacterium]
MIKGFHGCWKLLRFMDGYLDIIYKIHYPKIDKGIKYEHLGIPGTGLTGRGKRPLK